MYNAHARNSGSIRAAARADYTVSALVLFLWPATCVSRIFQGTVPQSAITRAHALESFN